MPDANELVKAIKRAASDAVDAAKPVNIYFGQVISVKPLQINVEQKMVLGSAQLVLAQRVTDYRTTITVDWETDSALKTHKHGLQGNTGDGGIDTHTHSIRGDTESVDLNHTHGIRGEKGVIVHNALKAGDEVILMRQQEGQKYIVIDRIGGD